MSSFWLLAGAACENATTGVPPDTYDLRWRGAEQTGKHFQLRWDLALRRRGRSACQWHRRQRLSSGVRHSTPSRSCRLLSVDPFGGVIITDWYAPPESPDERFKMTVYIQGRTLRSDGVQVSVFRQERGEDGLRGRTVATEPGHRGQPRRQDSRPRPTAADRTAQPIERAASRAGRGGAAAQARPSCYRDAALRHRPGGGSERCR